MTFVYRKHSDFEKAIKDLDITLTNSFLPLSLTPPPSLPPSLPRMVTKANKDGCVITNKHIAARPSA